MTSKISYLPQGSYQSTVKDVYVTIKARCKNKKGDYVDSEITITPSDADWLQDIVNEDGQLKKVVTG